MTAFVLGILTVIKALLLVAACFYVLWLYYLIAAPGFADGPPYVGSKPDVVAAMAALAAFRPGETVVDLGSGDGRLIIAAAKAGCTAVGYEINPFLVLRTRLALRRLGLADRARILRRDFWRADLSGADVVMIFGFSTIMERLQRKFAAELKPGARVVSSRYRLPDWKPEEERDRVFLYRHDPSRPLP
ncbi:MAG: hypothetical protein RL272_812 [Candidatus Parcubacteria bacterium]|jgi:precorrin-6B methylase 2